MNGKREENQKVFNIMAKGLLTQMSRSVAAAGTCAYRGRDGLKCAIGFLIPDDRYDPSLEGQDVISEPDCESDLSLLMYELYPAVDVRLLDEVRDVHDSDSPQSWKENLQFIAKKYGLEMPVTKRRERHTNEEPEEHDEPGTVRQGGRTSPQTRKEVQGPDSRGTGSS